MNSVDVGMFNCFMMDGEGAALIKHGKSYCDGEYFTIVFHKNHIIGNCSYSKEEFDDLKIDLENSRFVSPNNLVDKISGYLNRPVKLIGFSFESDPDYYDDMEETEVAQTVLLYDGYQYLEIIIADDIDYYSDEVNRLDLPFIHVRKYRNYEDTKFFAMENNEFDGFAYKLYKTDGIGNITPYVMSRGDVIYASTDHDLHFNPAMETLNPVGIAMGPIKLIFLGEEGDLYTFTTGISYDRDKCYDYLADINYR